MAAKPCPSGKRLITPIRGAEAALAVSRSLGKTCANIQDYAKNIPEIGMKLVRSEKCKAPSTGLEKGFTVVSRPRSGVHIFGPFPRAGSMIICLAVGTFRP